MVWKKGKILIKHGVKYFGDDVQLPPVLDSPVYNTSGKTAAALHGALVWKNFNHAVNLQQVVRQVPDQQQLKEVLLALREYKTTSCHANWLQNFQWNNLRLKYGTYFFADCLKMVCLFSLPMKRFGVIIR